MVVDRQRPQREPLERAAEGAGAEHHPVGAHAPPLRAHDDAALLAVERRDRGVLVQAHAEPLGGGGQAPDELAGVDQADGGVEEAGQVAR